jgi:hypothetical protein
MAWLKRLVCLAVLLLGGLGVVACAALTVGVWIADVRVSHTTRFVFAKLDGSLHVAQERVGRAEQRVDEAALTVDDVKRALEGFARQQAVEQLRVRLEVDEKAARLAALLEQADGWIETSQASAELVRRAIDLANDAGAAVDGGSVDRLLAELELLRTRLKIATDLVDKLRGQTSADGEGGRLRERLEQAAQLALRVVAALGVVQTRLRQFGAKIQETQRELRGVESRTLRWIHTVAIVATLLLLWMLAGQLALCRYAWSGLRW